MIPQGPTVLYGVFPVLVVLAMKAMIIGSPPILFGHLKNTALTA